MRAGGIGRAAARHRALRARRHRRRYGRPIARPIGPKPHPFPAPGQNRGQSALSSAAGTVVAQCGDAGAWPVPARAVPPALPHAPPLADKAARKSTLTPVSHLATTPAMLARGLRPAREPAHDQHHLHPAHGRPRCPAWLRPVRHLHRAHARAVRALLGAPGDRSAAAGGARRGVAGVRRQGVRAAGAVLRGELFHHHGPRRAPRGGLHRTLRLAAGAAGGDGPAARAVVPRRRA